MSTVAVPCLATVAEDFEGEEGELSLPQGTSVVVVKCDDDGWWTVHTKKSIGIFPGSYLDVHEIIKLPCSAKIVKNFREMNLNIGEIVQVQDISEEGWMIESKSNLGFCTWDYLEIVKDVPQQRGPQGPPQGQPQQVSPQQQRLSQQGPPQGQPQQQRPPSQIPVQQGPPQGQPQQQRPPQQGSPQQRPPSQAPGQGPPGQQRPPQQGPPQGQPQQRPPSQAPGQQGPPQGQPQQRPPSQAPGQQGPPQGQPQQRPPSQVPGQQGPPQQRPPQQGPPQGQPQQRPPSQAPGQQGPPQGQPQQQRPPSQLNPNNQKPQPLSNTAPVNKPQPKPQQNGPARAGTNANNSPGTGGRNTLFKKKQSILNLPDPEYRFSGFNINSDISELHGRKEQSYDPYLMPNQRNAPKFEQDGRWEFRAFRDLPPPPPFKDVPKEYVSGSMASYIDWKAKERSAVFDI